MKRFPCVLLILLLLFSSARADISGLWQLVHGDTDLFALVVHPDMTGEVYQAPDKKPDPVYGALLMSGRFALGRVLVLPNGEVYACTLEEKDGGTQRLLLEKNGSVLSYLHVPTLPQLFLSSEESVFEGEHGETLTIMPDGRCTLDSQEGMYDFGLVRLPEKEYIFQYVPASGDYLLLEAEGDDAGASVRFLPAAR